MKLYYSIIFILFSSFLGASEAPEKIRFFCGLNPKSQFYSAYSELYTQAFSQLGYDFEMLPRPLNRVTADLIRGTSDGECGRVVNLSELTGRESFVRVEAKVARVMTNAWTYNPSIHSISEEDLRSNAYRIGIQRGDLRLEEKLKLLAVEYKELDSPEMGLKMLYAGRLDLLIIASLRVEAVFQVKPNLKRPINVGNFMALDIYPYLHDKHRHLAVPFARELKKLIANPKNKVHKYSGLVVE